MKKICAMCKKEKSYENFYNDKKLKDGKSSYCKSCWSKRNKNYRKDPLVREKINDRAKEWRANNKEKINENVKRWRKNNPTRSVEIKKKHDLKRMYNLSIEDFEKIKKDQLSSCAICKNKTRLEVDHDHLCCDGPNSCGECVRGLLCRKCNSMIAFANDSTDILSEAIVYINKYKNKV